MSPTIGCMIYKDFHNNNLFTVKCVLRQVTKLVSGQYFPTFSLISGTIYNGYRGVNKYRHHFGISKLRKLMFTSLLNSNKPQNHLRF